VGTIIFVGLIVVLALGALLNTEQGASCAYTGGLIVCLLVFAVFFGCLIFFGGLCTSFALR